MFEYTIKKAYNTEAFQKQCQLLVRYMPDLIDVGYFVDVDESEIQIYDFGGKKIKVVNDVDIDAVYIESEVNLEEYFDQKMD